MKTFHHTVCLFLDKDSIWYVSIISVLQARSCVIARDNPS